MKKVFVGLSFLLISFLFQASVVSAVHVNGYYRSNGTYVNSYERTAPDGNPYNNYSYPGNYNPNTGRITGGSSATYLNNYYDTSSYSSSYSYPSTPTCPLNAYYDGISSCKCNYGYVASGSSCVSGNSMCWDELGYSSSYDSLENTCKCDYGYVIGSSGQCVSGTSYCSNQIGVMSRYNTSSKKCECMSGYQYDGSSCVYKASNYNYSSSVSASDCPVNSHESPSDSTKCLCNTGYEVNSSKTACVASVIKTTSSSCPVDKIVRNNMCISHTQDCQLSFGVNTVGTAGANGNSTCSCSRGYYWNNTKTSCLKAN
jgi:hypothetical protein